MQKYFPSIDHEILKTILRRKVKCPETLWLIEMIIDRSNEQDPIVEYFPGDLLLAPVEGRHELAIDNLTSQFFANCYLNGLDHFVKEHLKAAHYLRYVDDFALFSEDAEFLTEARLAIEVQLATLRLRIHPIKSQLFETRLGTNFVGFRVLPNLIRVRNDNLRRSRHRLRSYQAAYASGKITLQQLNQRIQSWVARLEHGDTWRLRQSIFQAWSFPPPPQKSIKLSLG